MVSYEWAHKLVELHDQDGFPLYLSLEMSKEVGLQPALLGILGAMAARGWGKATALAVARQYKALFGATAGEQAAIDILAA